LTTAAARHLIASGGNGPKERLTHNKDQQAGKTESLPNPGQCTLPVAHVEQALIATAVAHAGDQICSIDRYSSRPDPPAVRYGATIGFHDGWKLFLSCYGTTRPSQPRPGQPYHPASHL
jgi:hypothetical protein